MKMTEPEYSRWVMREVGAVKPSTATMYLNLCSEGGGGGFSRAGVAGRLGLGLGVAMQREWCTSRAWCLDASGVD